jgi:UDPglucose--hexose-1-phosphate uridylyltransferase
VPPIVNRELEAEQQHFAKTGRSLFDAWLLEELEGSRLIDQNHSFAAVVPFFARYPYEIWIGPVVPLTSLAQCEPRQLDDLAEIIHRTAQRYDMLFGFSMPYVMAVHQQPARGDYPYTRLHVEFYPPYRTAEKLKFLAGSESGAGTFINDTLPEESAARLRELVL